MKTRAVGGSLRLARPRDRCRSCPPGRRPHPPRSGRWRCPPPGRRLRSSRAAPAPARRCRPGGSGCRRSPACRRRSPRHALGSRPARHWPPAATAGQARARLRQTNMIEGHLATNRQEPGRSPCQDLRYPSSLAQEGDDASGKSCCAGVSSGPAGLGYRSRQWRPHAKMKSAAVRLVRNRTVTSFTSAAVLSRSMTVSEPLISIVSPAKPVTP